MANKRQRKKNAKKSYTGGQYRGGRQKNTKNLQYVNDTIINQHGVSFTTEEKKQLESLVNSINRKSKRMKNEYGQLSRKVRGVDTGDTLGSLQLMGKESDMLIQKRTKSLQRFRSREQFNKYMKTLKKVNSPNYLTERIRQYKRNYIKALENAFDDDAKDIVNKIRRMNPEKYMRMVEQDELLEIGYLYTDEQRRGKLNQIRASFGMELTEDDFPVEYE